MVNCVFSQSGATVTGVLLGSNQPALFQGTAKGDSLLFIITPPAGVSSIDGGAVIRNDSASFWYGYKVYSGDSIANGKWDSIINVQGYGTAVRAKGMRTLVVDVSYTGTTPITSAHPITVYVFTAPIFIDEHTTAPVAGLPVYSKAGTVTFTLTDSSSVYVAAFAGVGPDFNPNRCLVPTTISYGVYGNQAGGTPATIDSAATKNISITFGDEHTLAFPAYFPGGLLEYKGSFLQGFRFGPYWENHAIAADTMDGLYLLDSLSKIHLYSQAFTARGIMTGKNGDTVTARDIAVTPSGDMFALLASGAGRILKRNHGHDAADDTTIVLKGTGYYNRFAVGGNKTIVAANLTSRAIEMYDSSGALVAKRDSAQVRTDWNHTGTVMDITALAADESGGIYVGIDSWMTDSEPGYDAVIVYDSLLRPLRTIWQSYQIDGPFGIAVDKDKYIYAVSHWRDNVMVFDSSGQRYSATWWDSDPGIDSGRTRRPVDVAYGKNVLFVADYGNSRVSVYARNPPSIEGRGFSPREPYASKLQNGSDLAVRRTGAAALVAHFSLHTPSNARIIVRDLKGRVVESDDLGSLSKGSHDVQLSAGKKATGIYMAQLLLDNRVAHEALFVQIK